MITGEELRQFMKEDDSIWGESDQKFSYPDEIIARVRVNLRSEKEKILDKYKNDFKGGVSDSLELLDGKNASDAEAIINVLRSFFSWVELDADFEIIMEKVILGAMERDYTISKGLESEDTEEQN